MIVVSAMIAIAEGKGDEYAAEFAKLAPLVRRDPGCLTYVLHRMIGTPTGSSCSSSTMTRTPSSTTPPPPTSSPTARRPRTS